jgi:hypothetical protein
MISSSNQMDREFIDKTFINKVFSKQIEISKSKSRSFEELIQLLALNS